MVEAHIVRCGRFGDGHVSSGKLATDRDLCMGRGWVILYADRVVSTVPRSDGLKSGEASRPSQC